FPNNLLVPLGSQQFIIDETGDAVAFSRINTNPPLIVITSNEERELPDAFVRRCIVFKIEPPGRDDLVNLAQEVFRQSEPAAVDRLRSIADKLIEVRGPKRLNTAEFLDVVRAINSLNADTAIWEQIIRHTTWTAADEAGTR